MNGTEKVIKHLEMTQAVINRLGRNSFMLKSWSMTNPCCSNGFNRQRRFAKFIFCLSPFSSYCRVLDFGWLLSLAGTVVPKGLR